MRKYLNLTKEITDHLEIPEELTAQAYECLLLDILQRYNNSEYWDYESLYDMATKEELSQKQDGYKIPKTIMEKLKG